MKVRSYSRGSYHDELSAHFEALYPSVGPCPDRIQLEKILQKKIARGKTFADVREDVIEHCTLIVKLGENQIDQILKEYCLDGQYANDTNFFMPKKKLVGPLKGNYY